MLFSYIRKISSFWASSLHFNSLAFILGSLKYMKKKISVISLILLFFVSTTGLPFAVNFCTMMDTPEADICVMHSDHKTCECEAHKLSVNSEISKDDCCKTELIDKSICDKYIQINIQDNNIIQYAAAVIDNDFLADNNLVVNSSKYLSTASPPTLLNNHIYLDNSILLI